MLTAGALLTPPIESCAGANHAAGNDLRSTVHLRLTAASVSVRPPPYSNTDTRAGLRYVECVMVADYVRLALRDQCTGYRSASRWSP